MKPVLLMIYNADGGWENAALDTLHKFFSPHTYPCRLCDITYGLLKMNPVWHNYLNTLSCEKVFLHKDEFRQSSWYQDIPLPAIAWIDNKGFTTLISAERMHQIHHVNGLIEEVQLAISSRE